MKWFRFILFLLIVCAGFSVLNALQPDRAAYRWERFYQLAPDSLDIVFMGNSHNFVAFNPQVIDDILNTNSYVVGIDAENIIATYYELKEVLKSQQPRAVVLETLALDNKQQSMVEKGYIYEFLDAGPLTENKIFLIADLLFQDNLAGLFPLTRERFDWEQPYFYFRSLKYLLDEKEQSEPDIMRGVMIIPDIYPTSKYEEYLSNAIPVSQEINPANLDYMHRFLSVCNQNKVLPIFVTVPTLELYPRNYKEYANIIARDYNMEILSFNQQNFQQLHFYNITHVNSFGSLIVSTEMAAKLSHALNIPFDRQKLDYYHSYYFKNFDVSQTDHEAAFTLFPVDRDAPLLYAWRVVFEEKIIQERDFQPVNSISFPISQSGEYEIRVQVWNPDGDFVLKGEFLHRVEKK